MRTPLPDSYAYDHAAPLVHVAAEDGMTCARCKARIALGPVYAPGAYVSLIHAGSPAGSWLTLRPPQCEMR